MNKQHTIAHLPKLLYSLGVVPLDGQLSESLKYYYPVLLDGKLIGYVHDDIAKNVEEKLRAMKVKGVQKVYS